MTTLKMYIADAFTKEVFKGNPAAVCVMDQWLPADVMQHIAMENNFSETAFAVKEGNGYGLRWFTPGGEIDLCGHATLGTSYVLAHFYEPGAAAFHFHTKSGELTVTHQGDLFSMDLPAYDMKRIPVTDAMAEAFGVRPVEAWLARDLVCVFASEDQVRNCQPDMARRPDMQHHGAGSRIRLREPLLRPQTERGGRPRVRFRPLSYHSRHGGQTGQERPGRLPGVETDGRPLLPPRKWTHFHGRLCRALFQGGNFVLSGKSQQKSG